MKKLSLLIIALLGIGVILSGCATNRTAYHGRKNTLVKDIPADQGCSSCNYTEKINDWVRIANMTDEEICKALKCPERVVTKEVIKEVPGPERIVTKEVIKEVPVEKIVEKEVKKPFFVLPGVFFDVDKAVIRPGGKMELDKAAATLKEMGNPAIVVSGHTDSTASDEYNQKLSERRAESVKAYLMEKGIPGNKISTAGYGESKPTATNATDAGRQQNRRVEIDLVNP